MTRIKESLDKLITDSWGSLVPVAALGLAAGISGRLIDAAVPASAIQDGEIQKGMVLALPLIYVMNGGLNSILREDRGMYDMIAWGSYTAGVSVAYADRIYGALQSLF